MTPDLVLLAALARIPEARLARVLELWAAAGWTITRKQREGQKDER